jgi:hypothetical protein
MTPNTRQRTYLRLALLMTVTVQLLTDGYVGISAENRNLRQSKHTAQQLASSMVFTVEKQAKQITELKIENERIRDQVEGYRVHSRSVRMQKGISGVYTVPNLRDGRNGTAERQKGRE